MEHKRTTPLSQIQINNGDLNMEKYSLSIDITYHSDEGLILPWQITTELKGMITSGQGDMFYENKKQALNEAIRYLRQQLRRIPEE